MRRVLLALQLVVVAVAAGAAVLPLPAAIVEHRYSNGLYPALQVRLTTWSNETAISLFDVALAFTILVLLTLWARWLRAALRRRSVWPAARGLAYTILAAAMLYLWFLVAWGFNYAREPLEAKIGYEASRVSSEALVRLAERATQAVNDTYTSGHEAGFGSADEMPPALVRALHDVERQLGKAVPTVPGRPKRTLLAPFFRASGVDGMHAPFLLETLLNPDLTPPERPAVLAHEWAHLAGYAPEDDASFVGLVAALQADPGSQYSAWLALFHDALGQLPAADQRRLIARLDAGPRQDRQDIIRRLQSRSEPVSRVSWEAYDRYLKAQGVQEGLASYSRVIQLVLGSGALDPSSGATRIKSPNAAGLQEPPGRN